MSDWYKKKAQVKFETFVSEKRRRERELQKNLDDTDHKTFADYEPKPGEDIDAIKTQRSTWRAEIREVQAWLKENATEYNQD